MPTSSEARGPTASPAPAPVIRLRGVGKRYRTGRTPYDTLGDALARVGRRLAGRRPPETPRASIYMTRAAAERAARSPGEHWALRDISLDVQPGEVLGIIGDNGAGKSTLLKLIGEITDPTRGEIEITGRVGTLLEVGTGFHPELTGRENIYLNGAVLGMRRREIRERFDRIVAFAEIGPFLDTPVKRYSSGMYVRLAFAVAAHLEPEILLVDEVLAVGDAAFQQKCLQTLETVSRSGRTILFVSHHMGAITSLCTRAIWISDGAVAADGSPSETVERYLAHVREQASSVPIAERTDRGGTGEIRVTRLHAGTVDKPDSGYWICGSPGRIELQCVCADTEPRGNVHVSVGVRSLTGNPLLHFSTQATHRRVHHVRSGGVFRLEVPRVPLEPGRYVLNVDVHHGATRTDHLRNAALLDVLAGDFYGAGGSDAAGGVLCEHAWSFSPAAE